MFDREDLRNQIMIVDALGAVYANNQLRLLTTTDVLYYSKAGVYTAIGATPTAHHTSHENGGSDEISVAGLSGLLADSQTPLAHKTSHQDGGSDEIDVTGLAGLLNDSQKVSVRRNSTGSVFQHERINFVEGSNITISLANGSSETNVTITASSSLPAATAIGQVLFSVDGSTFTVQQPVVDSTAGWLNDGNGVLLVT